MHTYPFRVVLRHLSVPYPKLFESTVASQLLWTLQTASDTLRAAVSLMAFAPVVLTCT